MSKHAWLVWSAFGLSLVVVLSAIAYMPVYWSWESRTTQSIGRVPVKMVRVHYSFIMKKMSFIYSPLVRLHASIHGFEYVTSKIQEWDGAIWSDLYAPKQKHDSGIRIKE